MEVLRLLSRFLNALPHRTKISTFNTCYITLSCVTEYEVGSRPGEQLAASWSRSIGPLCHAAPGSKRFLAEIAMWNLGEFGKGTRGMCSYCVTFSWQVGVGGCLCDVRWAMGSGLSMAAYSMDMALPRNKSWHTLVLQSCWVLGFR